MSGAKAARPELDALVALAEAGGCEVVIISKLDRLGRSLLHLLTLMQHFDQLGVRIVGVNGSVDTSSPSGRMMVQLLGVFAEFEREMIRERMQEGMRRRVEDGGFVSSVPPYGYRAVPDPSGRGVVLDIDPVQQTAIRAMYGWLIVDRLPLARVRELLNATGHLSPRGQEWTLSALSRWVRGTGPATASGVSRWNDLTVSIPPILTPEEATEWAAWAAATESPINGPRTYLLSGLVTSPCGHTYSGRTPETAKRRQSAIYACSHKLVTRTSDPDYCGCGNILTSALDAAVWSQVYKTLTTPATMTALVAGALHDPLESTGIDIGGETVTTRAAEAARTVSKLREQIATEYQAATAAGFDTQTALLMVAPLQEAMTEAKAELARMGRARAAIKRGRSKAAAEAAAQTLRDALDSLDHDGRRDALLAADVSVHVTGFEVCDVCGGSGYKSGHRRPPQPCERCLRMKRLPVVKVTIALPAALADLLDIAI